jgi:carboxylesterase
MRTAASPQGAQVEGWEPFAHQCDSPVGVLVVHGFTSTPASVLPLARAFADAGFNVECPCLSGHGTTWHDLARVSAETWLMDLQEPLLSLKGRCRIVFVVGLSLGGTLALRLAQMDPGIRGVAVINHALFFRSRLVPFAKLLKGLIPSTRAIASDIRAPGVKEIAYGRTPTAGVAEVHRLAGWVLKDLAHLRTPLLIFKSRVDHVLPATNATHTYQEVASTDKELVWLDNSYHVATLDNDKDLIAAWCLKFMRRLVQDTPAPE